MEKILSTDEISSGDQLSVVVDDTPALVVRISDDYFVIEDVCSHDGQPLTDGVVANGAIACPRHGAKFDLKTGAALCMPATKGIRTFDVEIRDGGVWAGPKSTVNSPGKGEAPKPPAGGTQPTDAVSATSSAVATTEEATTDSGPSSELDYLEALRQVIDPELMINIVDLGLIYSVEQDEENDRRVKVDMTLTSPACPAGPQLVQQSKMALERLHDVDEAAITMVMSPPWSPERMTDDARDQLGIF